VFSVLPSQRLHDCNMVAARKKVFSVWSVPRTSGGKRTSLEYREDLESAVSSGETDPSEVTATDRTGGGMKAGGAPIVVSRCLATPN
jgi:hypothetical protein